MSQPDLEIRPFPVKEASPAEYTAFSRHNNRIRLERMPNDPPIPVQETIDNLHSLPPFVDVRLWAAWTPQGEIAAIGNVVLMRTDDNQHLAQFDISVLPEYRRQGLARRMLRLVTEAARSDKRRLLITETVDRTPAGQLFMGRLGAEKGLETHTNQLVTADLDRDLLAKWLARGREHLDEFELGLWEGAYPEDKLPAILELYELNNQQPFGELEIEDQHVTAEQVRQTEHNLFARGGQRWTYYLTERLSGAFVGYTETVWNPNRPEILRQDMTGVFPHYRNKGFGRWLKAAMLDKVLKDRPEVKYIRTGNADSNAAMLKINTALGFQPYMAVALWQMEVQKVLDYLDK